MTIGTILKVIGGLAVSLAVLSVVVQVEDWSRDLSQNHAETSADSKDPRLRPITTTLGRTETMALVRRSALSLPGWREKVEGLMIGPVSEVRFVRTTPIFRFEDDVVVQIKDYRTHREIHIKSDSRVGKGDLGQNPRNVRMLHYRLERDLARAPR